MKPLKELPPTEARKLVGVLFDLDDTVLDHGALGQRTFAALHALAQSGLRLLGVTGRPASWGQVLVRQWPVDAMITENGAIGLVVSKGSVRFLDRFKMGERTAMKKRLSALSEQLQERHPELELTDDAFGRLTDVTFDIGESRTVAEDVIAQASSWALQQGAKVTRSSVHLHVSLDPDDKATGSLRVLGELFGEDSTEARSRYAFIGDSGNDAPCFAAFSTTIGVGNLRGRFSLPPRYQTEGCMGDGFCEFAEHLLACRLSAGVE